MGEKEYSDVVSVTYMYLKKAKWKTKLKVINRKELEYYQNNYRIIQVVDYDITEDYCREES